MTTPNEAMRAACAHRRYSIDTKEQIGHCIDCGAEGRMVFTVSALSTEAPAQDDTKRLDWLADKSHKIGNVTLPAECVNRNLHSLRAAIDDAMEMHAAEIAKGGGK